MKRNSLVLGIGCMLLAVFSLISLGGCRKKEARMPAERVLNIHAQPAEKRSLRPFIETVGTLIPYEEVTVSAEVDGILKDVRADNGSRVARGQVLAVIDDSDYVLEVRRAEASVKQAEATLANIRLEYQRKEALYREQLVTQQQFDDVRTRMALADSEVDRAEAALSLARQKQAKTKIHSPLAGEVKEKQIERGNYVKNGTPLFSIIRSHPIKLIFTVTEKDLGKIKRGQEIIFRVDAFPVREFQGKLTTIYPSLEEHTRSLQVEAQISNQSGQLKPGLFARITLYTGVERDVILVPVTSLLYEGDTIKVFVAEGDRAKERVVKVGQKYHLPAGARSQSSAGVNAEFTEITEGVREGEMIVTVGQQSLFDGAKIAVAGQEKGSTQ